MRSTTHIIRYDDKLQCRKCKAINDPSEVGFSPPMCPNCGNIGKGKRVVARLEKTTYHGDSLWESIKIFFEYMFQKRTEPTLWVYDRDLE